MLEPLTWTSDQLAMARDLAIDEFRRERLEEPIEIYSEQLDHYQGVFEELLEESVDLLHGHRLEALLTEKRFLEAIRYLAGPPISEDDLKTLADVESLAPSRLRQDKDAAVRVVSVVLNCCDRRRFPWLSLEREASESERNCAVLGSACLLAYSRTQALRRNEGQRTQEEKTERALKAAGLLKVKKRKIDVLGKAPNAGEFCGECICGTRRADFVVGLWDHRKMLVECKVSNSEVNSVKRLNNDAAVKAEVWIKDFGPRNVVPVAVLSGVYHLANLIEAQQRGLTLIWAHDLRVLERWCQQTRG